MLEVNSISVGYGHLQAVWDVTFKVDDKELVTILGSNGSGKSTILKAISGLIGLINGTIAFQGKRIDGMKPDEIVSKRIIHVPEGRHLFPEMTVHDNLLLGAYDRSIRNTRNHTLEFVYECFPVLRDFIRKQAGTLSGGEQQMVAIGRGLMAKPKLLMLDEPSLGLAPFIVLDLFNIIRRINDQEVAVLLVEQNVRYSLKVAHRGYILESGRLVMSGTGTELLGSEEVKKAYLAGKGVDTNGNK